MTMPPLPSGYEPHELPADYTGPLWIEGQMRAYGEACALAERERIIEACIDIVAMHGGSVEIEAAIRAQGETP